jgi:hypothetical protein
MEVITSKFWKQKPREGKRNLRMEKEIKGKKQKKRSNSENQSPEIHCKVEQIRNNNPGWCERESGKLSER